MELARGSWSWLGGPQACNEVEAVGFPGFWTPKYPWKSRKSREQNLGSLAGSSLGLRGKSRDLAGPIGRVLGLTAAD